MANRWEKKWKQWQILFSWAPKSLQSVTGTVKLKTLASWKKSYDKPRQDIKKQRYHFADKGLCSQSYGFSSSHVWMWELNYKESWVPKIWCFWTVVLEKTLESPLDSNEIKSVNPKGNQPWIFIRRPDAEAVSCSVVPDSLRPHGLQPTRLLCPWDFPGKDTGVDCHFLLQGMMKLKLQ